MFRFFLLSLCLAIYVSVLLKEAGRCGHELMPPVHLLTLPLNYLIKEHASDGRGPLLDTQAYPELELLKDHWYSIWREYDRAEKHLLMKIQGERFFSSDITNDGRWKRIKLKFYGPWQNEAQFPRTVALLKKVPGLKAAMFSVLEPGAVIHPHVGYNSGCARAHLALEAPLDAYIQFEKDKYEWTAGQLRVFDDTYVHSVRHNGAFRRVVLFMDIDRKTRAHTARFIMNGLADLFARET